MSIFARFFSKKTTTQKSPPVTLPRSSVLGPAEAAAPHDFVWLNKQGVKSSHGFQVQFTGQFEAVYSEGAANITIHVEPSGMNSIGIKNNAFERWNNSSLRNSPERQAEILRNFQAALDFQGLRLEPGIRRASEA